MWRNKLNTWHASNQNDVMPKWSTKSLIFTVIDLKLEPSEIVIWHFHRNYMEFPIVVCLNNIVLHCILLRWITFFFSASDHQSSSQQQLPLIDGKGIMNIKSEMLRRLPWRTVEDHRKNDVHVGLFQRIAAVASIYYSNHNLCSFYDSREYASNNLFS